MTAQVVTCVAIARYAFPPLLTEIVVLFLRNNIARSPDNVYQSWLIQIRKIGFKCSQLSCNIYDNVP